MRQLISLGVRCDVAFQLRMHSGNNTAHYFDWLAIPAKGVIEILRRDFDVFAPDDLAYVQREANSGYVHDTRTRTHFHHQFPHFGGGVTTQFLLHYEVFANKFDYLAKCFRETVRTCPVTLVRRDIDQDQAKRLEKTFFTLFPNADARFLYLNDSAETFRTKHGAGLCLPKDTFSVGDPIAWSRLLKSEGLIDVPYRLTANEIFGYENDAHSLSPENRFTAEHCVDALQHNPQSALFRYEYGRVLKGSDRPAALRVLEEALELAPDHALIRKTYIGLAMELGEISREAAVSELRKLEEITSDFDISLTLAEVFRGASNWEEALACYVKHLRLHPADPVAYQGKAVCLRELGQFGAAEKAIDTSVAIRSISPPLHEERASILAALSKWPDVIAACEDAVRLAPVMQARLEPLMERARTAMSSEVSAEKAQPTWFARLLGAKA